MFSENVKPHIRDFILNFEKDFMVVDRNYRQFSSADALERLGYLTSQLALTGDKQVFESDLDAEAERMHRSVSQIEEVTQLNVSSF